LLADSALGLGEVDRAFVTIDCKFRINFLRVEMVTDDKIVDTSQGPTGHAADNE
jgi:hypothetical protein